MIPTFVHSIWTIFKKDLAIWSHNPLSIMTSIVPILSTLLIGALGAATVGRSPVALVTLDSGSKGYQMQQIFHQADIFRITDTTPQEAQNLLHTLQVVAVITIPTNFTQR